jgi:hypothetical protein
MLLRLARQMGTNRLELRVRGDQFREDLLQREDRKRQGETILEHNHRDANTSTTQSHISFMVKTKPGKIVVVAIPNQTSTMFSVDTCCVVNASEKRRKCDFSGHKHLNSISKNSVELDKWDAGDSSLNPESESSVLSLRNVA